MPFLSLPDGTSMEVPKGISEDKALELARKNFPEAFPEEYAKHKEKTGLLPAVKSGFTSGAGSALEGLGNLFKSEDVAKYGKELTQTAAEQYEPTTAEDIGVARRQGITSLLGTGLSKYITEPVGGAVGSLAGRYGAPIAAGAGAAYVAPGGAILGAGASALGFAAANFPIHFGENITRQKELGQTPDYGKALIPAMIQTAVDSAGNAIVNGAMRGVAIKTATQEANLLAPKVLSGAMKPEEATAQISGRVMSVLKGTTEAAGAGIASGVVTEAGRRVSAGQEMFSQEALHQYTESAKEMGLVAPFFGLLHAGQPARAKRLIDEARAKGEAQRTGIAREQQADNAGIMAEHYASPEGMLELKEARDPILREMGDIKEALKGKGLSKDEKTLGKEKLQELQAQLDEINNRVGVPKTATEEGAAPNTLEGRLEALRAKREEDAAAQEEVLKKARVGLELGEDKPKASELKGLSDNLTVREKEAQAKELEDMRSMLTNSIPRMKNMVASIEQQRDAALESGDVATYRKLAADHSQVSDALEAAKKQQKTLPKSPEQERTSLEQDLAQLKRDAAKYTGPAYDKEVVDKIANKIEDAQKRLNELPKAEQEDLFAPKQEGLKFEETPEEKTYASKQAELEKTFANTDKYLIDKLFDTVNAQGKEEPATTARIARLERSIEEAKASGDEKSEAALLDRLDNLKDQMNLRPEDARNKALLDQQKSVDNLRDAIEDAKAGRYLGVETKDTSTAESTKSGLMDKARGHAAEYIEAAIRDINARRNAAKQKPLDVDESLKLAFDLKDALDKVIDNKNLSVLLRPEYVQQRLKIKGATTAEEKVALKKLGAQYAKTRKEGALAEGVSQIEKQLAGIKQKYFEGEPLRKGEKQFFSSMERDAAQMLRTEEAKKNPNMEVVKALTREVEAGRKENARLEAERAKQEEIDMERYAPSGVNPDQYSLFKEKELEPVATVRATPANFMKFVHVQSAKLKSSMDAAKAALEKAAEKDKIKGTSAAQDRAKMEAEYAKKAPLIGRLTARLEDSFAENKAAAKERSAELRKLFSLPLENKLIADIRKTKKEIKKYEKIAAGERLHKFKEGYQKYADQLKATVEQAEDYLDKIRKRETQLFTIEGENNKRSVQMTRKVLKEALDENKVTEKQAEPISREIDRLEAVNQAEIEKRATETRLAEQEALERQASLPSTRQELVGTNIVLPGTKDEIIQKRVVERKTPLTAEEKRANLYKESAEGAKEMQAIRKQLGLDKPKRKDVIADSKAYIKALEERIEVNDKKRRVTGPRTEAHKKFKNVVDVLTKELENEKENLAEQQKLAKAERALAVAGNAPERKQRLKPLKSGTVNVEKENEAFLKAKPEYDTEPLYGVEKDSRGNIVFRKGTDEKGTADVKGTSLIADAFREKLPEGVKFEYADTAEKLPDYVKTEVGADNLADMKGAVLKDGTIVAIGDRHADLQDFQSTLAHESIGHYAVDRLLGKKGLIALGNKIQAQDGGIIRMAREMGVLNDVMRAIRVAHADNPKLTPEGEMLVSLREMIAHVTEKPVEQGMIAKSVRFIKELVGALKNWLGLDKYIKATDADVFALIKRAKRNFEEGKLPTGEIGLEPAYRKASPTDRNDPRYILSEALVAKPKGVVEKVQGNLIAFNTQFVDRLAPLKEIFRREGEKGPVLQMMYNLLAHGQRTNITSETVVNGARTFARDPVTGEITIQASGGPGMKNVLQELLQSNAGNPQALNEMFTAYAAAKRAKNVGFEKLVRDGEINGAKITKDMLAAAERAGDADPAFVKAFETYQKYNHGLVDMLADSGTISKEQAARFKAKNYIPYYRSRGGNVDLVIGNEAPIRIGALKDQPYLHELVGDQEKIQDFFKSSVVNTNMITEMALRNNATASVANTLKGLGIAEVRKGNGPASTDVIRFKSNGKDYHAVIDTSKNAAFSDISPQLLVKGLEGIPTQLPGIVKLMGVPANWLRKGVTRNPFYAYKQLIRDPMSAWLTSGADFVPILSSLKEVNKAIKGGSETSKRLQEAGILGGEVYTGRAEDLNQIVTRLESGKINLTSAMAFMDKMASEADASTRSVLYDNYRKQGLSDMQAQIATMESMNFNTRGASPSMHWINTMVPFFNSAIQGYNVMYKAFTGKMPFAKKLELQNKLIKRGSLIAGMSVLYAIAQQDNPAYQNATPDQKYMNWIIPGMGKEGKEGFRLPIPFEAGYIFKALPEALVNMAYKDDKAREGLEAISTVLQATNPLGVPTAIKAPIEIAMNRSLYTGRDIESKRLLAMEPGQRAYDNTSEPAKQLGALLNISPVQIDYLARNYFGGMYTTVVSLVNPAIMDSAQVKPEGTLADLPVFGQMFQPEDAGGITQRAYQVMEKASRKSETYKHLTEIGDEKKAAAYAKENEAEIGMGQSAASMKSQLDQLSNAIRTVKEQRLPAGMAPAEFAAQKRRQLTELQQARAQLAKDFTASLAEIKRQSSR
jgi:hypothetical protein